MPLSMMEIKAVHVVRLELLVLLIQAQRQSWHLVVQSGVVSTTKLCIGPKTGLTGVVADIGVLPCIRTTRILKQVAR